MKKRVILVCLCLLMSIPAVFAENEVLVETEVTAVSAAKEDFSPRLVEKIKMQRSTIYNSLNLTPCQLKKVEEIDKRRYEQLEPELKKMCLARSRVKEIADCIEKGGNKYTKQDVRSAKKDFDNAKNNIKSISRKYDKEFKCILNSEQKAKYNVVRKLKKNDLKKLEKAQKNGQKQSDLRPFGKPVSQAAYTEEMKKQRSIWNKIKNCRKTNQ